MCSKKCDGSFEAPLKEQVDGVLSASSDDLFRLRSFNSSGASASRWVRRGRKLLFASTVLTGAFALGQMPSAAAAECTDTDGDGFGWDGENTCDPDEDSAVDPVEPEVVVPEAAESEPEVEVEPEVVVPEVEVGPEVAPEPEVVVPEVVVPEVEVVPEAEVVTPVAPKRQQGASQESILCIDTDGDGFGWDGTNTCSPPITATELAPVDQIDLAPERTEIGIERSTQGPDLLEELTLVAVQAESNPAPNPADGVGQPVDVPATNSVPSKSSPVASPSLDSVVEPNASSVTAPIDSPTASPAEGETKSAAPTGVGDGLAAPAPAQAKSENLPPLAGIPNLDTSNLETSNLDTSNLDTSNPDTVVSSQAEQLVVQPVTGCVDTDGDGFGWNGVTTCIPSARNGSNFATVSNGYLDAAGSTVNAVGTERASDGRQTVEVTWDSIAGASGYNVFRDGNYIGSANGGRLTLTDVIPAGASGNYSIRAFDQYGTYGDTGAPVSSSSASTDQQLPVGQQPVTNPTLATPPDGSGTVQPPAVPIVAPTPGTGTGAVDQTPGSVGQPAPQQLPCIDTDGDGYGWDGSATCIPNTTIVVGPGDPPPPGTPITDGPCSQQLLVVGDSWAHYSYPTLNDVFTDQGWCVHRDSPDGTINFAEIGSVSQQFQPGETLNTGVIERLDDICLTNCDDVSIFFSIGGNDFLEFPTDPAGQVEAAGQLGQRIATSIGSFAQAAPNVEVVLPGYDILNVDNSALCRALPAFITGDADAPLGVTAVVPRSMATINDNLAAALPNTKHADLIGTLQGDPGNRDITTLPSRFLTREDCIHATDEGHKVFAEEAAMVIDPTLSLPGASAIDVNAPDPIVPNPIGPNERPGIGIQPTTDIPPNPETYDSLTIDYQIINNIEMDDPNLEIFGRDISDDEIELKVIEFGITPGKPETAYTRVLPRQGQISADEGDKKNIPQHVGLYGFSDLNPIGFKEFREDAVLPDLIGHVVIAYENDDGGLGDSLEDDVVQRAADQLKIELVDIIGPIKEPLDIAVAPQQIIDQVFDGTDRVNDAAKPQTWFNERLAEGFGQLVDVNAIFYFVTDPETSDKLNPAFNQFREIDTPALGGAATNQSFVLDFRRGNPDDPDPHYEVVVDVRLGTGLATSADPPPSPPMNSSGDERNEIAAIDPLPPQPQSDSDGSQDNFAQEVADEYSGGDLGGEFAGTPTAPAPSPSAPAPTPAQHNSMADERAEQADRGGNDGGGSDNNNGGGQDTGSTAQGAADTYSGGDLGGEFG